jgi:DNA-binding NarL/FixJ family response regulator
VEKARDGERGWEAPNRFTRAPFRLIAEGKSNREIAAHLLTTEDSIKNHVKNTLSKLGASDRTHAVVIAVKRGIIEL